MEKIWKRAAACAALASVLAAPSTLAAERDEINPWLDCGLGAMVFPDENLEIGAGISNVTWDLGSTAITSATASPDTCKGTDNVKTALFIQQMFDELMVDVAKGNGEYVDTLAALNGCSGDAQGAFVAGLREEFAAEAADASFAELSQSEKAQTLYFAGKKVTETTLAGQCKIGA